MGSMFEEDEALRDSTKKLYLSIKVARRECNYGSQDCEKCSSKGKFKDCEIIAQYSQK